MIRSKFIKGVTVTALEPGYVETEFADRADLNGTALTKSGQTPDTVAKIGYDAMLKGKINVINEPFLAFQLNWLMPFLPPAFFTLASIASQILSVILIEKALLCAKAIK